jgi:hypothetical protein
VANNYELHIGFPTHEQEAARRLLDVLQNERKGWGYSEVFNVHSDPDLEDPHNVPGTLGYLVSRDFPGKGEHADEDVLAEAQWVLSKISSLNIKDARLEIEFVFGVAKRSTGYGSDSTFLSWESPVLPSSKLQFHHAERILETPNSEIHFVIERARNKSTPDTIAGCLTSGKASQMLKAHGVNIQQTIEYRSQAMRETGISDNKLICTSYYDSPSLAEHEAQRLLNESSLSEEFAEQGYKVKLVLERILGCFKPSLGQQPYGITSETTIEMSLPN